MNNNTTNNEKAYELSDLDNYLRKFPTYQVLKMVGSYSLKLFKEKTFFKTIPVKIGYKEYQPKITSNGLAYIAFRSISESNDGRNSKEFNLHSLLHCNDIFHQLDEPILHDGRVESLMLRISHNQFPIWQENHFRERVGRYYYLLSNYDFKKITGFSLRDYILSGLKIFELVYQKNCPYFSYSEIENIQSNKNQIKKFLDVASANYWDIRKKEERAKTFSKYEKYKFNPLLVYPIIKGDDNFNYYNDYQFFIPSILLLLNKVITGPYWIVRDYYKEKDSKDFLDPFGHTFKEYTGDILKHCFENEKIHDLDEKHKDIDSKKADWWVELKDVDLIFECKASLFPQRIKQKFNLQEFEKWLQERDFSKAVNQLLETESLLPNKKKQKYFILVTLEDFYLSEVPEIKKLISNEIDKFYTLKVADLEKLKPWVEKYGIKEIFKKKKEIDKKKSQKEGREIIDAAKKIDKSIQPKNDFLQEVCNELFRK